MERLKRHSHRGILIVECCRVGPLFHQLYLSINVKGCFKRYIYKIFKNQNFHSEVRDSCSLRVLCVKMTYCVVGNLIKYNDFTKVFT